MPTESASTSRRRHPTHRRLSQDPVGGTPAEPARGKGKRSGLRVIDYHFQTDHQIWLMTLFGKGEVADLTPAEKRQLNVAIGAEAAARAAQRGRRS